MNVVATHIKRQAEALHQFLCIWSEGILLSDIGPKLTCMECEALAKLLEAHGLGMSAETLRLDHSLADDEGDMQKHVAIKKAHQATLTI